MTGQVSPRRVDLPHDFPLELLPPVCVVTGAPADAAYPVTLVPVGETGSRTAEGGEAVLTLLLTYLLSGFNYVAWRSPSVSDSCTLSLPFSAQAARRHRLERGTGSLFKVTGIVLPALLVFTIVALRSGLLDGSPLMQGTGKLVPTWWYLLPALMAATSAAGAAVLALCAQPAVRCVRLGSRWIALELPSLEAASALRAALARVSR